MLGIKYLILITQREYSERYLDFFNRHGVERVLSVLSHGTANEKTLDYLGIEKTEKITFETMIKDDIKDALIKDMYLEMDIGGLNNGIAVFLPIDGIGGKSSLEYFVGDKSVEKKEKNEMSESKTVLIITIVDKGNTDLVMDAARSAGASGGTVVKAKGTGAELAKFFGVSISEEKEMVYIVASRNDRDNIMKAIMEKAGNNTDAHGVVFSLPVDSVVGIKNFE
jgi:nitrogen regulatory protein PII